MGILSGAVTDVDGEAGGDSEDDEEVEEECVNVEDDNDDETEVADDEVVDAGGCRVGVVFDQVGR